MRRLLGGVVTSLVACAALLATQPAIATAWNGPTALPSNCSQAPGVRIDAWTNAGGTIYAAGRTPCSSVPRLVVGSARSGYHAYVMPILADGGAPSVVAVAHDSTGTYVVVFDGASTLTLWKRVPDGSVHRLRVLATSTDAYDVRIKADNGRWIALWSAYRNGRRAVMVARTLAGGDGRTHQLTAPPSGWDDVVNAVALHPGGPFVVAFDRQSPADGAMAVYVRRFRVADDRWDAARRIVAPQPSIERFVNGMVFDGSRLLMLGARYDTRRQASGTKSLMTLTSDGSLSSRWAPSTSNLLTLDAHGRPSVGGWTTSHNLTVGTLGVAGWTTSTLPWKTAQPLALTPTSTGVAFYYQDYASPDVAKVVWR